MRITNMFFTFGIRGNQFRVFNKPAWLEFNIYAPNGDWRRFYISKKGLEYLDNAPVVSLKELLSIGNSLLIKIADIDKMSAS